MLDQWLRKFLLAQEPAWLVQELLEAAKKVNTGGVSLAVFELLTATYASDNFNLRDDWDARRAEFSAHDVLDEFEATDFLQILTLLSTGERRARYEAARPGDERAPAVSCKRRDVLRLELHDSSRNAGSSRTVFRRALPTASSTSQPSVRAPVVTSRGLRRASTWRGSSRTSRSRPTTSMRSSDPNPRIVWS
jgi:hypothetical protein